MNKGFLREILGKIKNVNVLEEVKDPKSVFEYLKLSVELKKEIDKNKILEQKDRLFDPELDIEERKKLLIQLASVDELEAYQILEKFSSDLLADQVSDFVKIALQESRALLQSTLLGEPTVLITSGLGGKEDKLRYFIILFAKEKKPFTLTQKQIIEKEANFIAEENNCIIEKLDIHDYLVIITMLIPYTTLPTDILENLVENINYLGDFLCKDYVLRNDRTLTTRESKQLVDKIYSGELKTSQIDSFIEDLGLARDDENI